MSDVFILYPDVRLKTAAEARPPDDALRAMGRRLLDAALAHKAYGLAGAHLGAVEPLIVISISSPETRDYRVLYNPQVLETAGVAEAGAEGSVSLPGIEVQIVRPAHAVIGYDDDAGIHQTLSLSGFAARVALHEIEQMNGIFFLSHLSRPKREAALRRYEKLRREKSSTLF